MSPRVKRGVWTAIITPFTETGEVDWKSFENLVKRQAESGVVGIVISGTTGEGATLLVGEKLSLIRKARTLVGSQVEIMAGTGTSDTNQSLELSSLAVEAGADSLLVVTPPYSKPSLTGLIGHYKAISEKAPVPICLYHIPGRTGQCLAIDEILAICAVPGVSSIKEASNNLELFSRLSMEPTLDIFSGDDLTYLPSLAIGGSGVISVISNLFPNEMVAMSRAFQARNNSLALKYHQALLPMMQVLFCESNPSPLKAILSVAGLCTRHVRSPLATVTSESFEKIKKIYQSTEAALKRIHE